MGIYIVNGFPGSGKTTFEYAVLNEIGRNWGFMLSTITPVKEIASKCGWNWTKTPRDRKFLSDLKDLLTDYNDFSFKWIMAQVKEIEFEFAQYGINPEKGCVFIDCREPWDIKRYCEKLGAKTILVRRPNGIDDYSNHADAEVENYEYDIEILNDGTLDDLEMAAKKFVEAEGLGPTCR